MRTTQQFSNTLPTEMARDRAMENWLQNQVAPVYDALKADLSRAVSIADVRAKLASVHKAAITKV